MAVKFQLRRDTAANWVSANTVLDLGEPGVETDTLKLKVGDGVTPWTSLDYSIIRDFAELANKPTTLSGYGITDAATSAQGALADTAIQPSDGLSGVFTGDVNGSVFADDSTVMIDGVNATLNLANNSVTDLQGADQAVQTTDDVTFGSVTGNVITTQIDSGDSSAIEIQTDVDMLAGLTVGNHIIPSSSENIDLGSASARFRDLYLSGNSAVIGDLALKRHTTGGLLVSDHSTGDPTNLTTHNITANNITTAGYIAGPAVFTIDPAAVGDNTGKVVIAGDLQVDGVQTTINSTTVAIDDLNFSIATDAADSAAANGAGITVGGANANITYTHATTSWDFNKPVNVTGDIGVTGTVDGVDIATRDGVLGTTTTTANAALPKAGGTMSGNIVMDANDISGAGTISATTYSGITLGGSLSGDYTDAKVQYGTSYSGTPAQGSFFFDSLNAKLKVYNGSSFVDAVPAGAGGGGGGGASDATATFRKYNYDITSTTNSVSGKDSVVVTAGAFVIGYQYEILSVGDTDFQAIGASADTVGVTFTATGAGSGTGTAGHILNYVTDGTQNVEVYRNGAKMVEGASDDYVSTTGTSVNFTFNLADGDVVDVQVYELLTQDSFYTKTETYTQAQVNSQIATGVSSYLPLAGGTITGSLNVGSTIKSDTVSGGFIKLKRTDTTTTNNSDIGAIDFEHTDSDDAGVAATILASGDGAAGGAKLRFYTGTPTTRQERLTILSNGNVGIGTDSPDAPLHINTQIGSSGGSASTVDYPLVISQEDIGNTVDQVIGAGVGVLFKNATNSSSEIGSAIASMRASTSDGNTSNELAFFISDNDTTLDEVVRIDVDGNIGIGTDNPTAKVTAYHSNNEITGLFKLWTNTADNTGTEGASIDWVASGDPTAVGAKIGATRAGSGAKMDLRFYTGRNTDADHEKVRITTGGNVGIGTDDPVSTLDVSSTNALGSVFRKDFNGPVADTFSKVAVTLWGQDHDDADVGTGTDQFGPMLGFGARIDDGNPNSGDVRAGISYSYNGDLTFHAKAGASVADGSYERMRIDGATGVVGIGTTPHTDWWSNSTALQISPAGALWNTSNYEDFNISNNVYTDGTERYIQNDAACKIRLTDAGLMDFRVAGAGTAGDAISWDTAMSITALGRVGVGLTQTDPVKFEVDSGTNEDKVMRIRLQDDNNSNATADPFSYEYKNLEIENNYSGAAPSANGTKVAKLQLTTVTAGGYAASASIMGLAESNSHEAGAMVFATGPNSSGLEVERMRISREGEVSITGPFLNKSNYMMVDSNWGQWSGKYQHLTCHNTVTASNTWTDVAFVSYSPSLTIQGTSQRDNTGSMGMASYLGTIFGGYGAVNVVAERNTANSMNGGGFGQLEYRYLNSGAASGSYRLQVRQAITAGTMYITTTLTGQAFSQITED